MPTKYSSKPVTKKSTSRKPWLLIGGIILLIILALVVTELTNTTHIFHTSTEPSTTNTSVNNTTTNTKPSTVKSTPGSGAKSTNPTSASSVSLQSPYQSTYVSNHSPATVNDRLQSVCVTSPGANCVIEFTMNGVTKSLAATKADSSGSAYWAWSPKQLGLTTGQWTASAKVTLNGQSKTSSDTIPLEVP